MKRKLIFITVMIMCVTLFTSMFTVDASAATIKPPLSEQHEGISKRATCNLNFREGPSTYYEIIGLLNLNEYIYITYEGSYPYEYGWVAESTNIYLTFGSRDGYVYNPYPYTNLGP